jgi:hypothetical protein
MDHKQIYYKSITNMAVKLSAGDNISGSSSFSMDNMIFNSRQRWFYEDIHTKQRRAQLLKFNTAHYPIVEMV